MQWLNEPTEWSDDGERITVSVPGETDAWRHTKHDFVQDDAPCYYREVGGDFTATVRFTGDYGTLYDQAGLVVRADTETWCKCGVELLDGQQHASAVVTREVSDWSVVPLEEPPEWLWIRVERSGSTVEVSYSRDGDDWTMFRQATLTDADPLQVGVLGAAPQGEGFEARFESFSVAAP